MKKLITLTSVVAVSAVFTSCQPANQAQANAGTGAAIGAVAGAIIGHQSGDAAKGAAVGAAAGAGGGYLYGQHKDKQAQGQ